MKHGFSRGYITVAITNNECWIGYKTQNSTN